jgi:integrase
MASLHKDPRNKNQFWQCAFTLPGGKRTIRSTKQKDRKKAERICFEWEQAARRAESGRLTESAARRVIGDIYELANGERLPAATVEAFLESWLAAKKPETSPATARSYADIVGRFLDYLGERKGLDLSRIGKADIAGFRDSFAKRGLARNTANVGLKVIRSAFTQAQRDGIVSENPAALVKGVKGTIGEAQRRAFTIRELEQILEAANDEWRGIILAGLYTGQRLGDLATLTWENVDLEKGEVKLVTGKTGRQQIIPLAKPLQRVFESLPAGDNPKQPLFPQANGVIERQGRVATLSNQFHEILTSAALTPRRTHQKRGGGRGVKRATGGLSFHCLRHTATSLLKNAGISPAIVQEFVGHDSKTVSAQYTHIETSALRAAADAMPDLSPKARKGAK